MSKISSTYIKLHMRETEMEEREKRENGDFFLKIRLQCKTTTV